jgi:hypothetical protein
LQRNSGNSEQECARFVGQPPQLAGAFSDVRQDLLKIVLAPVLRRRGANWRMSMSSKSKIALAVALAIVVTTTAFARQQTQPTKRESPASELASSVDLAGAQIQLVRGLAKNNPNGNYKLAVCFDIGINLDLPTRCWGNGL